MYRQGIMGWVALGMTCAVAPACSLSEADPPDPAEATTLQLVSLSELNSSRDPDETVDLNGDGRADLCGRGSAGVSCAVSTGSGFGAVSLWQSNFSDAAGWNINPGYYATIRFPDVNGDGKADVCGRGTAGILCGLGTGSSFGALSNWSASFSSAAGWIAGPEYYATIRFPDLNGDGKADVCGRGPAGISCALSTGSSFGPVTVWQPNFSDAAGWNTGPEYYATIRFPDVNGDGRADVCGRGSAGIFCALSTGSSFGAVSLWQPNFSNAAGWNTGPEYYDTIRFPDVNGDGKADVCGRGSAGISCALSTGSSFGPVSLWQTKFSDAAGFNTGPQYYATIQFADLDHDGKADLCGRGGAGVSCALSTGSAFGAVTLWQANFSDAAGWNTGPQYYATIRLADVDGDGRADLCGRGNAGIDCAISTGTAFGAVSVWQPNFSDAAGWNTGPQYYATIRLP